MRGERYDLDNKQNLNNMKKIALCIVALIATAPLHAQNGIDGALAEIETNNTTLKALQKSAEAQKRANHAENALADPEVGYNRLWGSPGSIGNRTDVSASQEFDIPTITGAKGRLAKGKDNMVEWQYKAERAAILLEAKLALIDAIYYNKYIAELERRLSHADAMLRAQSKSMEAGESNKMEYNNVSLNLAKIATEMKKAGAERQAVMRQLERLNGGQPLKVTEMEYAMMDLPADFQSWYQQNAEAHPALGYARSQQLTSRRQLSLEKQSALPSISLGYISEKTMGEHYQGVSVGLSVPLWSSSRRIKQARSEAEAAEAMREDAQRQLEGKLKEKFLLAKGLADAAAASKKALAESDNSRLLAKALQAGEISMVEYLVGLSYYYDAIDDTLTSERDSQKAYAELTDFLL